MFTQIVQILSSALRTGERDAFPKELEVDYQHHIAAEKIRTIRLCCLLVILLTTPFALVDIWALPSNLGLAWLIRASSFGIAVAFYRVTRTPRFLSQYTLIGVCLFLAVGLAIEALVAISSPSDAARAIYSNGVLLPVMAMYSLSFLSSRITFSVSFVFVTVYAFIGFGLHDGIREGQLATVLTNMLLLSSAAFIGLMSQIGRDGYERQAFLKRRALDNELIATEHARQLSEHFSNHDALTGLANRKAFEQQVGALLSANQAAGHDGAILFIDLDGFKPINDRYGHAVGDKVLQVIGQRISACVSRSDLVARIGGDEFVVALCLKSDQSHENRAAKQALRIAQRLVQEISLPMTVQAGFDTNAVEISVGASIGVSLASMHAKNPALLISMADQAMYQAKHAGKGSARLADSYADALEPIV
jgi:diguanylate cyclase (GGDEF)-like protein